MMGILRFLLAISVAVDHFGGAFGLHFGPGSVEVEAFFIISGFYMYLVLHTKYYRAGLSIFYSARYLRLLPSYLVVLLAAGAFSVVTDATHRFGMPFSEQIASLSAAPPQLYRIFSNRQPFNAWDRWFSLPWI